MAAVNSTATVVPTAMKLNNSAFATPLCHRFLRFSSPSLRRSKFTPLTASNHSSEEVPKIEQATGEQTKSAPTGAADVIASAKAFAEATKTAVIKQGDEVKDKAVEAADDTKTSVIEQGDSVEDKVFGVVEDMLEATKKSVDEAQGSLNPTSSTTDPASPEAKKE